MDLRQAVLAILGKHYSDEGDPHWHDQSRHAHRGRRPFSGKTKERSGFVFDKEGRILLVRLGPMNAQTQTHMNQPETNQPPVSRGMWAFPFGHVDPWFYNFKYQEFLPKRLRQEEIDRAYPWVDVLALPISQREAGKAQMAEREKLLVERQAKLDHFINHPPNNYRPKQFWHKGGLWSRLSHHPGEKSTRGWYYWDNPKDWARAAKKSLVGYAGDDRKQLMRFSKDHLEIFVET